jgi:chromosomal replication initiation ATPase DnaA
MFDNWCDHAPPKSKILMRTVNDPQLKEFTDDEVQTQLSQKTAQNVKLRAQLADAQKEIARLNHKLESLGDPEAVTFFTAKEIIRRVCKAYGLPIRDMLSPRRQKYLNQPRQHAMYLCKIYTDLSLPQIGKAFGNRDHTTVLHGIARHRQRRQAGISFPIIEGLDG